MAKLIPVLVLALAAGFITGSVTGAHASGEQADFVSEAQEARGRLLLASSDLECPKGVVCDKVSSSRAAAIPTGRRLHQFSCKGLSASVCQIVNSNTGSGTAIANAYNGQSSFAGAFVSNTNGAAQATAIATSTTNPAPPSAKPKSPPPKPGGRRLLEGSGIEMNGPTLSGANE